MGRQVSITKVVHAPAERIFDLLVDPAKHPLIDGSGTVRTVRAAAPTRLRLGDTFGMDMTMGVPYKVTNRVVEFEDNRLIAWRHFSGHRWRWQLRPLDEQTTEVTETFDYSTARASLLLVLLGYPERNRRGIEATLERLESVLAEQG
ncbi:MAG TPA: SRPBCC family protein [Pseudonocardiaceae bacterium]|nr:SRPBCC family protein [Pseudonocardiaceae bacterium]